MPVDMSDHYEEDFREANVEEALAYGEEQSFRRYNPVTKEYEKLAMNCDLR